MKITSIKIYRFSIPMKPFQIATGTMDYAQNVLIKIETDSNVFGLGECSAFPMIVGENQETCLIVAKELAKIWIGKNPLHIEERILELQIHIANNPTIKSAFDMALYDISAKNENLPLYKFLGGTAKKNIETDMTIGIDTVENMAQLALNYKNKGCTILKVKLGKNIHEDIARIKAIREMVGDKMTIRIDANQGWSFEDALFGLNEMEKYNIQFCEQPMRTWHDDKLPELCAKTNIKIMADESCYNHHDARKQINSNSCAYINIKFAKSGGIYEAQKINSIAAKNNIKCMIGGMLETRLAASAFLHFALANDNVVFYDMDTCMLGHLTDPIIGGLKYDGYFLSINDTPGIGAHVDEHFLSTCENWIIE
ncbi:MAG: dipeptide epimerase [Sphingobacteriaceae bacterium]|nr:dipeptide epimerase [Sphingobacteriaceae bacterium]